MHRRVRRSDAFMDQALAIFPADGSATGRATFALFERHVLAAIEVQFSRQFDDLPIAIDDVPAIRHVMTHNVPLFPALVVYGMLVNDVVELVAIDIDEDYFDLIDDDPIG